MFLLTDWRNYVFITIYAFGNAKITLLNMWTIDVSKYVQYEMNVIKQFVMVEIILPLNTIHK